MFKALVLAAGLACVASQANALAMLTGECGASEIIYRELRADGYKMEARADAVLETKFNFMTFWSVGRGEKGDMTKVFAENLNGLACLVVQLTNWKNGDE